MLDFLATATISDVAEVKAAHKAGVRKQRNPEEGLKIRLFKDGSVYPSAALVEKFNLEYQPKDAEQQGQGFDVIDTSLYPTFQVGKRILIISPVSRKEGKVDLFASTTYNEDGTPRASVMDQGAKTYGKNDLIPLLKEVYGDIFEETLSRDEGEKGPDHVDLVLVSDPTTGNPWELPEGKTVTFLPKKISRGKDKGQISTIRRERPVFYALLPVWMTDEKDNDRSGDVDQQADIPQEVPEASQAV